MARIFARRGLFIAGVVCFFLLAAAILLRAYLHDSLRGLPYHDSFARGRANEWTAYGGTWELRDGTMRNDSDERGARLTTGSLYWRNYSIEADVMLPGSGGDAGLVIRTSDEEQGVDSYTGYYAGLRSLDNTFVLGRAGHGWMENSLSLRPSSVRPSLWYHLKLMAVGCQIGATAVIAPSGETATVSAYDTNCVSNGRSGLRSYAAGGVWRNVVIRQATQQELTAMLQASKPGEVSAPSDASSENRSSQGFNAPIPLASPYSFHSSSHTQPIDGLRLKFLSEKGVATVRGNVIATSPMLFIQDNTGGVSVPNPVTSPSLKVGDQVEVTGEVSASDFSSSLERATVGLLWEGTPIPPVTMTASQAATGAHAATFIEVEGRLRHKETGPDNTLLFDLDSGPQSFRAILSNDRSNHLFEKVKHDSVLRLRGVCVTSPQYTHNATPFVLLLRSTDDVDVLAGPPWWNAGHIMELAIGLLFLAVIINFFYNRVEHWKLRAVLEERERLAHEMHDTLAQSFAGIGFQLEAIRSGVPPELPTTHQQLDLASDLVRHSHEEARRSISTLRPDSHRTGDLLPALEMCASKLVEGGSVEILTASTGDAVSIPLRITDTLYRIGQEAIANAIRHAHPTRITITLDYAQAAVCLSVMDNGSGLRQGQSPGGFGIRGMRKRAAVISATLQIISASGKGTCVRTIAPLPPRIKFISWPRTLWKHLKERISYVETH